MLKAIKDRDKELFKICVLAFNKIKGQSYGVVFKCAKIAKRAGFL